LAAGGKAVETERANEREPATAERTRHPMPEPRAWGVDSIQWFCGGLLNSKNRNERNR